MATFGQREYSIRELFDSYNRKELILSPKFQRRSVWEYKAKSYLIDSIVRGLPIPRLFIREKSRLDLTVIKEIVDGQQRLRTIFDFLNNGFVISPIHNPEFGNFKFKDLPDDRKMAFLNYTLSAVILIDLGDDEVFNIFSRLNTYAIKLNSQELLNSQFFGCYKQLVYHLAGEYRKFWLDSHLLSERSIARMEDAKLVSQLLSVIVSGKIESNSFKTDSYLYRKYDDNFPESSTLEHNFKETVDLISNIYNDELRDTAFSQVPLFYSLFLVLYHFKYNIQTFNLPTFPISLADIPRIRTALDDIDAKLKEKEPAQDISELLLTLTRNTTTPKVRIKRCKILGDLLSSYLA